MERFFNTMNMIKDIKDFLNTARTVRYYEYLAAEFRKELDNFSVKPVFEPYIGKRITIKVIQDADPMYREAKEVCSPIECTLVRVINGYLYYYTVSPNEVTRVALENIVDFYEI